MTRVDVNAALPTVDVTGDVTPIDCIYSHSCDRGSKLWPALFGSLTLTTLIFGHWPLTTQIFCPQISLNIWTATQVCEPAC